ncbi:MAG: AAA family ATPase [Oscillospiraceae bacterium]|nr:AAA family ATPase [Oscillospiraceae bacterium]
MGTITMLTSAKDGVGKSTIAVFLGVALAQQNEKTLVIELDNGFRSIDVISATFGKLVYDLDDALSGRVEPRKAIVESPLAENLYVMSAPFKSSSLKIEDFVRLTRSLGEEYEHIIIDTAATAGAVFTAASCAMRAIIVTTADPVNIRNSKQIEENLQEYSVSNIRLIINRVVTSQIKAGMVPDLDFVIDSIGAQLIGVIPELSELTLASAGVTSFTPNSFSMKIYSNIAARLNGNDRPLLVM